jgi:hypothetical protein
MPANSRGVRQWHSFAIDTETIHRSLAAIAARWPWSILRIDGEAEEQADRLLADQQAMYSERPVVLRDIRRERKSGWLAYLYNQTLRGDG